MAGEEPPSPLSLSRSLRCIVKLGGSAITHKDVLEHINNKDLAAVASQLRDVIMHSSTRGCMFDWSKRSGIPPTIPADFGDQVFFKFECFHLWFMEQSTGVAINHPEGFKIILRLQAIVNEDGSWRVVNPRPQDIDYQVEITVASHDTTGGMTTKISEAAMIAKLGFDVYIVKAGTTHSVKSLRGELNDLAGDWLGTAIRPSKKST